MADKRILTRLLRVRELEEEQSRQELEVAVGALARLEREWRGAEERRLAGRRSFLAQIGDVDTSGRAASGIEVEQAKAFRGHIEPKLDAAETEVARQREEFLARRTSRQQVETLLQNAERFAQEEAERRAQQMLDDWYGRRIGKVGKPKRLVTNAHGESGTRIGSWSERQS